MSAGQSNRGDPDDDTPKTRSYVDVLLRGDISPEQLASLRAEIISEDITDGRPRTPVPQGPPPRSPAPRTPMPVSGARAVTDDARTVVRSWPISPASPDPEDARTRDASFLLDDEDTNEARTVARSWPTPIPGSQPSSPNAAALAALESFVREEEEFEARTIARAWSSQFPQPAPSDEDELEVRTMAREWSASGAPPAHAVYEGDEETDQRTIARSWSTPAPQPAVAHFAGAPPSDDEDDDDDFTSMRLPAADSIAPPPSADAVAVDSARSGARQPFPTLDIGELSDLDLGWLGNADAQAPNEAPEAHTPPPRSVDFAPPSIDLGADLSIDLPPVAGGESLEDTYFATLGGPTGVPRITLPPARMKELPLSPHAAFVLSQIDGACSVDDILDISTLGRLDTLQILYDLAQQGVITVGR
jgi:hypothetical protein